jgi:MFS family permease
VGLLGGVVVVVFNVLGAVLSDAIGRRRVIMTAFAIGVPWSFVVLPLVDTGNAVLFALAMAGTYAVAGTAYGPMAAFIPEIFATRYRYSGAGVALNLAGLIGGAVPTIIAAPLLAAWGVPAIGLMMAGVVLVSLVCTARLPETKGTAMSVL